MLSFDPMQGTLQPTPSLGILCQTYGVSSQHLWGKEVFLPSFPKELTYPVMKKEALRGP